MASILRIRHTSASMQTSGISRTDMTKQPAVYILTNTRNGTLYTGVTSNLQKRVWQHKNNLVEGFSKQHSTHMLVFYEIHQNMINAITREKQIKHWQRSWKISLIETMNPYWRDLYPEIF
jgi:putative endonuclease